MTAAAILQSARESARLTQEVLARRTRVLQPNISRIESGRNSPNYATLEKLVARAGSRLTSVPSTRDDAPTAAAAISSAVARRDHDGAFRSWLDYSDGLSKEEGAIRVALTVARPQATGSDFWDAALAAVAEYWLGQTGLPQPEWIDDPARFLGEPRSLRRTPFDLEPDRSRVPHAFARRNLLIEEGVLASV